MSHNELTLFNSNELSDYGDSNLTILSFGAGQDSMAILLKLIFDKSFRKKYAPRKLIVLFADTGNEHPFTYDYIEKVVIPLCEEHKIEFVKITNDMGFHSEGWKSLTYQWERNRPTIGSMAYVKSCTHNLKLYPQYSYLGDRLAKDYTLPHGNKREYKAYARQHGKIRFLIGIAKNEEKRVNGNFFLNLKDKKIIGKIKIKKGVEFFVSEANEELLVSYEGSNRFVYIDKKRYQINFEYFAKYDAKWKEQALITEYPLLDIGYDRTACQKYIDSLNFELPYPSNCMFCPFSSGSHMEILWLYMNMPDRFYEWVKLEENKLNYFKNSVNFHLNKNKDLPRKRIEIAKFDFDALSLLNNYLAKAIKSNCEVVICCQDYVENQEIEEFVLNNDYVEKAVVKNLGVCARVHRNGQPFTLLDLLKEAQSKYPNVTLEELQRHKMSHGHCIESQY